MVFPLLGSVSGAPVSFWLLVWEGDGVVCCVVEHPVINSVRTDNIDNSLGRMFFIEILLRPWLCVLFIC